MVGPVTVGKSKDQLCTCISLVHVCTYKSVCYSISSFIILILYFHFLQLTYADLDFSERAEHTSRRKDTISKEDCVEYTTITGTG